MEGEYAALEASHEEIQHLLYKFMGGGPCKVDMGPVENGGVNATDGTYLHHGEQIRLTCDEEFEPADAEVKTCDNGQFSPSYDEKPLKCVQTIIDCDYIKKRNSSAKSGIYTIRPLKNDSTEMEVYCDMEGQNGWIVMQRRFDGGSISFAKNWEEYSEGFGNKSGEHWLGLRKMYEILKNKDYILRVVLETYYSEYKTFYLGPESENFTLNVEGYSGYAGDSFNSYPFNPEWNTNGQQFSTFDRNVSLPGQPSCSKRLGMGGWWFAPGCSGGSHLNGNSSYYDNEDPMARFRMGTQGIIWTQLSSTPLKSSKMMVRRR